MKASDELFQLIRSLTPSEKRYFKTNAKKESATSNYLQLFDAIDSQKEYDETLLKKKHTGKKFVKYLSAEKGYLHDQIMKQMRAFHAERTVDNKINELLQDEMFYRAKGLNDMRRKALEKARSLAEEFERFGLLQECLYRQVTYVEEFSDKTLEEPVKELLDELQKVSGIQSDYAGLWAVKKELFALFRSGADTKDDGVMGFVEELQERVNSLSKHKDSSFLISQLHYNALTDYGNLKGDREFAFENLYACYVAYGERPELKREYLLNYRILVSNLIGRAHAQRDFQKFDELLAELKSLPVDSYNAEGEVFQNVFFLEHLRYINNGEFDKAEALVPIIEAGLEKYATKINKARELAFKANIMIMYFVMHKFKDALKWADKILDEKGDIRQNILTLARVLYPIIHFELGHHDLVENLTRSTYRFLLKLKRLHGFERLMIKYLQDIPLSPDTEEFQIKLIAFSKNLVELKNDPKEKITLGFEEVELWVKSKIENRDMTDLIILA